MLSDFTALAYAVVLVFFWHQLIYPVCTCIEQ